MSNRQYILPAERTARTPDSARLLYVSRAQYSPEWNSTLHTHTCAELFFITGGSGTFQIRQEVFSVAPDDLVVVNTGVPHTESSQAANPMEYLVLGVAGLEALAGAEGYAFIHLSSGREEITTCLRLMEQELRGARRGYDNICQDLLDMLLLRLMRREDFLLSAAPVAAKANRECDQVRRYIDNHFKENLSLDQLAALVHINKYYLSHAFRKEFNVSPISYLIVRRIQESRFLLTETDHTLSQIAQILGFSSLSYFSQSFRKLEGMSPMDYRKRHRRQRAVRP